MHVYTSTGCGHNSYFLLWIVGKIIEKFYHADMPASQIALSTLMPKHALAQEGGWLSDPSTTLSEPSHSGSSYSVQGLIPVMNPAFYIFLSLKDTLLGETLYSIYKDLCPCLGVLLKQVNI